jgi:uncharacterized protein CbrC (UPF0167 family)
LCPWCIAVGTAHAKFGEYLFDEAALPDGLPETVVDEVARRNAPLPFLAMLNNGLRVARRMTFLEPVGIQDFATTTGNGVQRSQTSFTTFTFRAGAARAS